MLSQVSDIGKPICCAVQHYPTWFSVNIGWLFLRQMPKACSSKAGSLGLAAGSEAGAAHADAILKAEIDS
jgi:hypothetical protein